MNKERPDYISYLLRMWRTNGEGKVVWRASLESPRTGEHLGFASLEELFNFLRQQAGTSSNQATNETSEQKSSEVSQTFEPEEDA